MIYVTRNRAARLLALLGLSTGVLAAACSGGADEAVPKATATTAAPKAAATTAATAASTAVKSAATTTSTPAAGVRVRDAWARSTPGNPDENSAVYLVVENPGGADRLIGATVTPAISRTVELHVTEESGGTMVMRAVPGWDVPPAGGSLELKPGGNHVMLIGLNRQLKAGDTLSLTLKFEKAGDVRVDAPVRDAAAAAGGGMAMPK
jgi:copper(I)-binding protein